ncbi:uncharacterized protein F4822DRAFT_380946 [Hypoxylon trugodes]|uniref:uncharacterized protein n=1 Tax=Hypoxylon trugodes TaxID=326681 RepID=UPI00219C6232|nr:uncharacterized protein F4822DRAFT_380946 [Hypoxylon trugodes]KAI1385027.1 hypothetical protein F4822DRAFT_380946 [Hypoxylon trugodes]
MTGHMTSTGRGGAGNIADSARSPKIQPADLETPTLKTSVVTTGRGGSGNMAPNKDPIETRARQDVGPIERRASHGATHVGRGGAANIVRLSSEEAEIAKSNLNGTAAMGAATEEHGSAVPGSKKSQTNGLAAKAKEFFKGA